MSSLVNGETAFRRTFVAALRLPKKARPFENGDEIIALLGESHVHFTVRKFEGGVKDLRTVAVTFGTNYMDYLRYPRASFCTRILRNGQPQDLEAVIPMIKCELQTVHAGTRVLRGVLPELHPGFKSGKQDLLIQSWWRMEGKETGALRRHVDRHLCESKPRVKRAREEDSMVESVKRVAFELSPSASGDEFI